MFNGQAEQDKFLLNVLQMKKNGFFFRNRFKSPKKNITINNSYILEKEFSWNGIMIEYDNKFKDLYKIHRPKKYSYF